MNDYHAYKSTGGGSGGGGGCGSRIFLWILVLSAIIWLYGKLS